MPGQLTKLAREEKKEEVAKLNRRGHNQHEIARALGISQPQVCYYLKQISQMFRDRVIAERAELVEEKVAELREVRREAWECYEKSKKVAEKTVEEYGIPRGGDDDDSYAGALEKLKIIETREGRLPANEYLSTIRQTLKDEIELRGLDAPKKSEVLTGTLDLNKLLGPAGAEDLVEKQIKEIHAAPGIVEGEASPPAPGWYGAIKPNGKKKH